MADLNEVRLIGRLTRDPELQTLKSGLSLAKASLATSRKYKQDGESKEETCFVDFVAWGKIGENLVKYCKKGNPLYIGGHLKFESWDDKETSNKRTKLSVIAENIQFLGTSKKDCEQEPASASAKSNDGWGEPPF